jgi:GGDEF domain-containing protein
MLSTGEKPFAVQLFTREGRRLTHAVGAPSFCEAVAQTGMGRTVCNRGCGFSFALTNDSPAFQTFECPFGVSNAILQLDDSHRIIEPEADQVGAKILVGGRVFPGYAQFHAFVEKAVEMGASLETLLQDCERMEFRRAESLRGPLEAIAGRLRAAGERVSTLEGALFENRSKRVGVTEPRFFLKRLAEEISRAERFHHSFSLALVRVNMSDWLPGGADEQIRELVLKGVAGVLQPSIRGFDEITCFEDAAKDRGDKETFALLFPETDRVEAKLALERVLGSARDRFLSQVPRQREAAALHFEVGIAEYPTDGTEVANLREAALKELRSAERREIEIATGDAFDQEDPVWLNQSLPSMDTIDGDMSEAERAPADTADHHEEDF